MRSKRLIFWSGLALAINFAELASAAPGIIMTGLSSTGPVLVGETFTATFRISGYTDITEIDGFNFNVMYPDSIFAYAGGVSTGTASGTDQQWLTKSAQDEGFILSASIIPIPGVVMITMLDLGPGDPVTDLQGGTLADSGFLVAFDFRATAVGTGDITLAPIVGAGGPEVLFNTDLDPAGVPTLVGASMTVVPEPGPIALFVSGGLALLAFQFRRNRRR